MMALALTSPAQDSGNDASVGSLTELEHARASGTADVADSELRRTSPGLLSEGLRSG